MDLTRPMFLQCQVGHTHRRPNTALARPREVHRCVYLQPPPVLPDYPVRPAAHRPPDLTDPAHLICHPCPAGRDHHCPSIAPAHPQVLHTCATNQPPPAPRDCPPHLAKCHQTATTDPAHFLCCQCPVGPTHRCPSTAPGRPPVKHKCVQGQPPLAKPGSPARLDPHHQAAPPDPTHPREDQCLAGHIRPNPSTAHAPPRAKHTCD